VSALPSQIALTGNFHDPIQPQLGRFLNQDPIGFNGILNLFGYANSNPTSAVDPEGAKPVYTPVRHTPVKHREFAPEDPRETDSMWQAQHKAMQVSAQQGGVMKGLKVLQDPTRKHNCIGYAFLQSNLLGGWQKDHSSGFDIPYGQSLLQEFVDVGILRQISKAQARKGDLVVYQPGYENCSPHKEFPHIGIVEGASKAGVRVKSKWGPGGKYEHALDQVPPGYLNNGQFEGSFYRIINRPDGL